MKFNCTLVLFLCAIGLHAQNIVHTNVSSIHTRVDNNQQQVWTLAPEAKPDNLDVECKPRETRRVKFITPIDSAEFSIESGKTIDFIVLLNNKDTAYTRITGIASNVNFTKKYIAQNKHVTRVEIPEVHELVNIVIAIRDNATKDSNMVDFTTPYYQEVLRYFSPYKNHPIVRLISEQIKEREGKVFNIESYTNYYNYKMNACGYVFDSKNKIKNTGIIKRMGFRDKSDMLIETADMFADFAQTSGFRAFYSKHKPYYDSLVATYNKLTPISKMLVWLETKFKFDYGSYVVYFSPLIGGAHSTNRFEDNGFNQTFMFVCRATSSAHYSPKRNELFASRIVFTEIDHNFVNPVSDKKQEKINTVFAQRSKWVDTSNPGTNGYPNPYSVFNEYMTFAVFSLYAKDHSDGKDFDEFLEKDMNQLMSKGRGFIKFAGFNSALLAYYKANPTSSVESWYDYILDWCQKQ